MDNGSIADAVIANRGLNFAGNGYGYGGYGGHGREFANDGSNAVRINANRQLNSQGQDFLSQQISDNADRNSDLSLRSTLATMAASTSEKINDQTRFFAAEVNQLGREQSANAREAAKCCCEAKVLAVQNQAKTDAGLAQVLANQACDVRVADAVANSAQNAKLDLLLIERGRNGGHGGS